MNVRHPAAAGRFYPADVRQLRSLVREYVADAGDVGADAGAPKALIVPHAGYVYSGPIAASGYARLQSLREVVTRVVLLGPAHFVRFDGLAASGAEAFETPLGRVPVDVDAVRQIEALPQVRVMDEPHAPEHSLEVHLPFLQEVLGTFQIVPLVVGRAAADEVAEVIEALWGGPETLFVISSDLSHDHDYETARQMDRATSRLIEQQRYEDLGGQRACGFLPISGLLSAARTHHLTVETVDLRNSGDTAGPRDEVVGYGAFVVV